MDDGLKEVLRQLMFSNLCIPYLALDELVVKMQTWRIIFLVEGIQIRDLWGNQSFNWKQFKNLGMCQMIVLVTTHVASIIPWDLGPMIHNFSQEDYVNPSLVLLTIALD